MIVANNQHQPRIDAAQATIDEGIRCNVQSNMFHRHDRALAGNSYDRRFMAEVLVRIDDDRGLRMLRDELTDPKAADGRSPGWDRDQVLDALERLSTNSVIPLLIHFLRDPDPFRRDRARTALEAIGGVRAWIALTMAPRAPTVEELNRSFDKLTRDRGYSANKGSPGKSVIDLRSQAAKTLEKTTDAPLAGGREAVAQKILPLLRGEGPLSKENLGAIRGIGTSLNAEGGKQAMQAVAYRVKALGGNSRLLEGLWDGIGDWQG